MIRDYGGARSGMARPGRRPVGRDGRGGGEAMFKLLGMTLLVLALVAVISGLWVAWAVRSGLDEMAVEHQRREELQQQRRELTQRRDEWQARERIEAVAAELGLYPPRDGQIKR